LEAREFSVSWVPGARFCNPVVVELSGVAVPGTVGGAAGKGREEFGELDCKGVVTPGRPGGILGALGEPEEEEEGGGKVVEDDGKEEETGDPMPWVGEDCAPESCVNGVPSPAAGCGEKELSAGERTEPETKGREREAGRAATNAHETKRRRRTSSIGIV